ncbi:MAG: hypothetical protein IPM18_01225 [Phycisphaerales bacterium]|nr:hypothetical protein [Phycisphaerales bacterium]
MATKPQVPGAPPPPGDTFADREQRNPFFRAVMHLGLPVVVSAAIHLAFVGVLAFKTFEALGPTRVEIGEFEGSVVDRDAFARAFQWDSQAALDTPLDPLDDQSLESLLSFSDVSAPDFSDLSSAAAGAGSGDGGLGIGDGPLSLIGTGGGAGESGTGGLGGGLGGGGARLGQAGMWDLSIRANKVVFVVDFSGSIIPTVADLRRELKRSVSRLRPSQTFGAIVFFSENEQIRTESFRPKLEPATEENRREFFRWIDGMRPRGRTEPLNALKRALLLEPEAVFFLSDGLFDDRVVTEVEATNRTIRARIYCLVFDEIFFDDPPGTQRETTGVRRLKRLSEGSGGETKIVTNRDLMQ